MRLARLVAPALAIALLQGCATVPVRHEPAPPRATEGLASFYGAHGRRSTASGARFDPDALTAAHRTLPFGTRVRVTNLTNHRSVVVVITDRGPVSRTRLIDVSKAAARRLGFVRDGTTRVRITVLAEPDADR